jgi:hypothetical protein
MRRIEQASCHSANPSGHGCCNRFRIMATTVGEFIVARLYDWAQAASLAKALFTGDPDARGTVGDSIAQTFRRS